jgi:zinc protease
LIKFHQAWLKPNNSTLIIVGATTMAEIKPKLEKLFAGWKPGETPKKNIGIVALPTKPAVYLIDRPGSLQSVIIAGHVAPPSNNPDEVAITTMNRILGGEFSSRVNMNLREDKHWSYGARTFIPGARGQRPFMGYAPVQTDKTKESMIELAKELRALKLANTQAAATKVVHPDNLVWVVVGDCAKIEAGVRELGFGEIRLIDADGTPIQ